MQLQAVRLDPDGGEMVDTLRMQDISRSGIGAECDRPYYPGQRLVLCLHVGASNGRRNVYATIRRCKHTPDGYRLGMEFDSMSMGGWYGAGTNLAAA